MLERGTLIVAIVLGLIVSTVRADSSQDRAFQADVAPLLADFCVKCHGGEKPKGGLNLTTFRDASSAMKARKTWDRVRDALESGTMPPEDQPQPPQDRASKAASWIKVNLTKVDCKIQDEPGRVTLRRLNRAEYRNTVRDLVGIDYAQTDDFPSDDVGYGFDNIGDVLTLPPILMEKYLNAAEEIASRAIVDDNPLKPTVKHITLGDESGGFAYSNRFGRMLSSEGEIWAKHEFPLDGDYLLRVRAFGQQAGPEPVKMAIKFDGKVVKQFDVKSVEATTGSYEAKFRAEKGTHTVSTAFLNDFYDANEKDPKRRDRNLVIRSYEVVGPMPVGNGRLPDSHRRIVFKKPKGYDDVDAIRAILDRTASRAFRRPATAEDVTRLMRLVELAKLDGERIEVGLRLALQGILVSPHFLFRVELDRAAEGASQRIDDFEMASRLSYFLWSSMPDDELFDAARSGLMRSPGTLETQVARMLKDPRSRALTENFAGQWLQIRKLKDVTPDKTQFPNFDPALRDAMRRETELFFEAIVREDRSILEFLDADFTFMNDRLAKHYGMAGGSGTEFHRVNLTDGRRGGVLTQASVLTVTSNPTRTSPVKRGKWVLEQLLGTPPPPPPPNVPELAENKEALTGTLRQRMEQHRANPNCASCHAKMDPLGFGLENFDAIGAWREKDGSNAIDTSGVLPGGQSFRGPKGLRDVLKTKSPEFTKCLTGKLLTFAIGRGLEDTDQCVVDQIAQTVAADRHRFSRLVLEIVRSDPFQKRKSRGDAQE